MTDFEDIKKSKLKLRCNRDNWKAQCLITESLMKQLYKAAKKLSDSCRDNYGDNGVYEVYFDQKAKYDLDKIIREYEQKMINPGWKVS